MDAGGRRGVRQRWNLMIRRAVTYGSLGWVANPHAAQLIALFEFIHPYRLHPQRVL